jgi:hypothetical protein
MRARLSKDIELISRNRSRLFSKVKEVLEHFDWTPARVRWRGKAKGGNNQGPQESMDFRFFSVISSSVRKQNSKEYKPKWHRSKCCGQKCTRMRCARVKT